MQRGNVSLSNLQVLNAILFVAENGCKWRGLPVRFGNWHTIYTRMNRWPKKGVLDRVFEHLQREKILRVKLEVLSIDSTVVKVHPDGTAASKNGPESIGKSRGGWTNKVHLVVSDGGTALRVSLSPAPSPDAPEGRKLLQGLGPQHQTPFLVMDRAYQDNQTQQLVWALGYTPVVPLLQTRAEPWECDVQIYTRRNEMERLFRRLKGYRRIFTRYEKLDVLFFGFMLFALIFVALC